MSAFLLAGQHILIQQRALGKYHTPGLWANTCCTHPEWEEDPDRCATRRLREELGIEGLPLRHCGQVDYRAGVGNGLIEHEVVEVYAGMAGLNLQLAPDPDEVMATRWVSRATLLSDMAATPAAFTLWLHIYMQQHADMIFGTVSLDA